MWKVVSAFTFGFLAELRFSVTKGIDSDMIVSQLPAQLQLELYVHLNCKMVQQVTGSIRPQSTISTTISHKFSQSP